MSDFDGKAILITGATSGLGATTAVALAGRGAKAAISLDGGETTRLY